MPLLPQKITKVELRGRTTLAWSDTLVRVHFSPIFWSCLAGNEILFSKPQLEKLAHRACSGYRTNFVL